MDRHLWQIQPVRDVLVVLAAFGVFWLGYKTSAVTVPLLLAVTLAYVAEPVIGRLASLRGMSRGRAVAAAMVAVLGFVVVPSGVGVTVAAVQGAELATRGLGAAHAVAVSVADPDNPTKAERVPAGPATLLRDRLVQAMRPAAGGAAGADDTHDTNDTNDAENTPPGGAAPLGAAGEAGEVSPGGVNVVDSALRAAVAWLADNPTAVAQRAALAGVDVVATAAGVLRAAGVTAFALFLTAFFFFFVSSRWPSVLLFGRGLIPRKNRTRALELIGKMDRVIAAFVRGRLTIAVIQALVFSLGYWIIGVPAPALLGIVVALLAIVPYAGLVGLPASMLLLWFAHLDGVRGTWWWVIAAPVVVYQFGQLLDDYVLTPMIQGKETDLDVPTVLFATIAGGVLFGIYGLLIAIPLAACAKILIREVAWPLVQEWLAGKRSDPLPLE